MPTAIFTTADLTDLYIHFAGSDIAGRMEEVTGGSGDVQSWYIPKESDLVDAELPAGTHYGCIQRGDYENPSWDDSIEEGGTFNGFVWDGETETGGSGSGSGSNGVVWIYSDDQLGRDAARKQRDSYVSE